MLLTADGIYGKVKNCEEHKKQSIRSHLTAIGPVSVHDMDFIHRQEAVLCTVSESG
mgnify:CR=1 FL=1